MPPLSPVASSLSPNHSQDGVFSLDLQLPCRSTGYVCRHIILLAQDCLTRLCLITLGSTLDPILLRSSAPGATDILPELGGASNGGCRPSGPISNTLCDSGCGLEAGVDLGGDQLDLLREECLPGHLEGWGEGAGGQDGDAVDEQFAQPRQPSDMHAQHWVDV
jgi:hypothetical protein